MDDKGLVFNPSVPFFLAIDARRTRCQRNRRQAGSYSTRPRPPAHTEAAVGACLQAIDAAGTPPERIKEETE